MLDISRTWSLYPSDLSGGMKQKLLVAMTMCTNPSIIFADEVTSALDVDAAFRVLEAISSSTASLFYVTQNLHMTSIFGDYIYVMLPSLREGQVVWMR